MGLRDLMTKLPHAQVAPGSYLPLILPPPPHLHFQAVWLLIMLGLSVEPNN